MSDDIPDAQPPVSVLRAWLQLIRLPNLFSVPGDLLAGYALAWSLVFATAGSSPLFHK